MRCLLAVLLIPGLPFGDCLMDDPIFCTEEFVYGVNVAVTDSATGAPIEGATLTLTDGDHSETMEELQAGSYAGAGERAGTYVLTIDAEGFDSMRIENIVVEADICHVVPVALDLALTPVSAPLSGS